MNERMAFADAMKTQLAEAGLSQATAMSASPEGQSFGNTAVVFRLGGMLLRFVRDRGQAFFEMGVESATAEFYQYDDVEIAMGWKTIDEVLGKREPEDLGVVLLRLRAHLADLNDACSGDRAELTRARFERAARDRGKAFTDRLRRKK
jgi:hypothetical protein